MRMEEQELAQRCARGDRRAREELYRRYSSRLFALCLRYSPDRPSAEDNLQDAFVKIYDKAWRFRWQGPGSLWSWMAKVALNQIFDKKRQRKLLQADVDTSFLENLPVEEPEYNQVTTIPTEKLAGLIESLPERYRTVFQLYCVDGLPHKDIAKLLGIKEKSSSANLARARAILAKEIKKLLV